MTKIVGTFAIVRVQMDDGFGRLWPRRIVYESYVVRVENDAACWPTLAENFVYKENSTNVYIHIYTM